MSSAILALINTLRCLADSRCACKVFAKATSARAKNSSLSSAFLMFCYSTHFSLWAVEKCNLYTSVPKVEKYFTFLVLALLPPIFFSPPNTMQNWHRMLTSAGLLGSQAPTLVHKEACR